MKTMKRIVCLFLAVMALAAILAIPASADAVVARYPAFTCSCGGIMYRTYYNGTTGESTYVCEDCGAKFTTYYKG